MGLGLFNILIIYKIKNSKMVDDIQIIIVSSEAWKMFSDKSQNTPLG